MSFAKHETFYIREGWLYKGMAAIKAAEAEDQLPTIFLDRDAPERLGIGRNMVRALRFWIQATGLTTEEREEGRTTHRLSEFGEWVWTNDRYFEDEATLWLIHYKLVTQKEQATSWYWFFNHFNSTTFDYETCLEALNTWVISDLPEQMIVRNSLKKDLDILLRTYIPNDRPTTPENLKECPLSRLGLLSSVGNKQESRYRRLSINSGRLPVLVLLYVLIDRQQAQRSDTLQVSLSQVLREPMNAGRVFSLTTAALADLLANLNKQHPDWSVRFVRTAGLDELDLPDVTANEILARYAQDRTPMLEVA